MPSVLIVDDLISIHEMLDAVIQPTGFSTAFATDGEKALTRYKAEKFDMVLADIDMKPMDGITLLKQLKQYDPNSVTIIMTAYASTESAVQALKFGAFDYLQKPFRVDELIATLRRGIEFREIQAQRARCPRAGIKIRRHRGPPDRQERPDQEADPAGEEAGRGPHARPPRSARTAPARTRSPRSSTGSPAPTGPSSSGSTARSAPSRASGTASSAERRGRPLGEDAKGGTLFLQHLQCLAVPVQKELVSVLRNTAHGFRLVCTTTEDLEKMVDEGRFNDELFYRVASLPLHMPSLRDRKEDIPSW
jgi:two-component system response regulator HydG